MKNAIVYSFFVREDFVTSNRCYKQMKYSIDTLRKFNKKIKVYIYLSPSTLDVSFLNFDKNTKIVKFDNNNKDGWPKDWVDLGYFEFLKHRWENAIDAINTNSLDNVLYLDTDTIFHKDPQVLFDKYGSTKVLWAKPDNSEDLMRKIEVWPGMNDGQFLISNKISTTKILDHMKFYVNHTLSHNKQKLTEAEWRNLCWVSTQYAVWDYFQNQNNPVQHFDENEVMLHVEPEYKDTKNLILHHYYNGNTEKFVPKEYL